MSQVQTIFYLPDTLRKWPWKRSISPHYLTAHAESVAWIESFKPFSPQAQVAFNKGNFDKMDALKTRELCDAAMDAILHPDKPRPVGENIIGEISRQFWQGARCGAPLPAQERFVSTWRKYLDSVVLQSERRTNGYICTADEYLAARRDNIGSDPAMVLLELCLEVDIPHEVMEHPAVASLTEYTSYLITLDNDLCSYKREFLSGNADYNAVTIAKTQLGMDLTDAVQWVSDLYDEIAHKFLQTMADVEAHKSGIPSWGAEMDSAVLAYINGLGTYMI
ncbi:hypothetical protein EIP86_007070 [Pleurotus ostreatoroseus]|nr:hypothetical protein EIP86_007070 [Pleurotus ostreatoroseus]